MVRKRRLLRTVPLLATAAALVAAAPASAGVTACASQSADPSQVSVSQVERSVLCLVNRERTSRGLKRLSMNGRLEKAAVSHSRDMVQRSYFDHVSLGGSTPLDRIKGSGYMTGARSYTYGENLAWGSDQLANPQNIVEKWMASPGHRRNILTGAFEEIGIGIALGTPRGLEGATYTTTFGGKR
jgi:uncharacterized protein YkwD